MPLVFTISKFRANSGLRSLPRKTSCQLAEQISEDLYYRISAISVALPPLRDRRNDILALARAFLKRFAAQAGRALTDSTPEASDRLRQHDWPGNVRQLQNEVQPSQKLVALGWKSAYTELAARCQRPCWG